MLCAQNEGHDDQRVETKTACYIANEMQRSFWHVEMLHTRSPNEQELNRIIIFRMFALFSNGMECYHRCDVLLHISAKNTHTHNTHIADGVLLRKLKLLPLCCIGDERPSEAPSLKSNHFREIFHCLQWANTHSRWTRRWEWRVFCDSPNDRDHLAHRARGRGEY